jgi:hypothetical protein
VYVVLNPPRPVIPQTAAKPPAHILPYEQEIARSRDTPAQQDSTAKDAAAPADAKPAPGQATATPSANQAAAPKPDVQAAAPAPGNAGTQDNAGNSDAGGMPPAEDADANDGGALPPNETSPRGQAALPRDDAPGQDDHSGQYDVTAVPPGGAPPGSPYGAPPEAYGPPPDAPYGPPPGAYGPPQKGPPVARPYEQEPQEGPYGQGGPYGQPPQDGPYSEANQGGPDGQPPQAGPYGQAPNGAAQGAPGVPQEEWVQVLVSGAGMYGTASEDAPMLFAFPYGRRLKVVSHYQGWVEVTDPQSATTGWMKAGHVAPVAGPGAPPQQAWRHHQPRPWRLLTRLSALEDKGAPGVIFLSTVGPIGDRHKIRKKRCISAIFWQLEGCHAAFVLHRKGVVEIATPRGPQWPYEVFTCFLAVPL